MAEKDTMDGLVEFVKKRGQIISVEYKIKENERPSLTVKIDGNLYGAVADDMTTMIREMKWRIKQG